MLDVLKGMFHSGVKCIPCSRVLRLTETNEDSLLKSLELRVPRSELDGCSGNLDGSIVISSDLNEGESDTIKRLLNAGFPHVNRRCDYIVFNRIDARLRVVLIELKSSDEGATSDRCYGQFVVTKALACYFIDLAKAYSVLQDDCDFQHLTPEFYRVAFYPAEGVIHPVDPEDNPLLKRKLVSDDKVIRLPISGVSQQGVGKAYWPNFLGALLPEDAVSG